MSPTLNHECTRVPVTALASCGSLLIAAEGPSLRFYCAKDSRYITSQRVFKAQAVHGIRVYSDEHSNLIKLIAWGGRLVRALEVVFATDGEGGLDFSLSTIGKASDWIFDIAPKPKALDDEAQYDIAVCVAVTAHNALSQVTVRRQNTDTPLENNPITVSISDLTSSSRSILYSAHLFWEDLDRVLVAAGTAFGEIIYWSWCDNSGDEPASRIHRVFLGHEGSIFGVQISKELPTECCQKLKRVVASCSDDRTIRIWDVSDVNTNITTSETQNDDLEVLRTRHTGFTNEAFDSHEFNSSDCLAIGWGHLSRVWTVRFLEASPCNGSLLLQSAGEDATARTWELAPSSGENSNSPYRLLELDCAAHHSGKNMWASVVSHNSTGMPQVIAGGADSKITATPLLRVLQAERNVPSGVAEYTIDDILSWAQSVTLHAEKSALATTQKSSKKSDFFRSYCFVDESTFLLTTNSGKVLVASLASEPGRNDSSLLSSSTLLDDLQDLSGYSVCASSSRPGVAFIAGANGSIYMYRKSVSALTKLHTTKCKVGDIFAAEVLDSACTTETVLLVTLAGQGKAQLMYVDPNQSVGILNDVHVPITDSLTGSVVTSMAHFRASGDDFIVVGFRRGSIALYGVRANEGQATLLRIIENVHNGEAVTSLAWNGTSADSSQAQLHSVGRDGRLTVHHVDLSMTSVALVHDLALPFGPNLEGLYLQEDRLLVHGFSSKKWYLYDVTAEEEVMSIETGGAHRSWAFRSHSSLGGILVWTRASSMHVCNQQGSNHKVIRSGGHGREIKSVATLSTGNAGSRTRLIATGAEDTDIKIFQYVNENLVCRRTIRKHTTGIQHLQWSVDGEYLFSSGGCEEFYVWRIRNLPTSSLDFGVVCEHVYHPESEHADLRIMSFDVTSRGTAHLITMVFSDSSIKAYRYDSTAVTKWKPLAKGIYFTSCLTQCVNLSPTKILTVGTDGHAVTWPLPEKADDLSAESMSSITELTWHHPAKIHQNSSKVMTTQVLDNDRTLLVSGGDDGSLAFLFARSAPSISTGSPATSYALPPIIVNRAHASAVTACAIYRRGVQLILLTSGNDEWIRLWKITLESGDKEGGNSNPATVEDALEIRRLDKVKTNVSDVSSMAVLDADEGAAGAKILICGVGMEVMRID